VARRASENESMKTKKANHGGRRPGSGRKPAGTVALLVRPLKETAERMRERARVEGKRLGQLLDETFGHPRAR